MKKRLLEFDEIATLVGMMRRAFQFFDQLRESNPLAEWIQYPKVPSILSESLVVHLINRRVIIGDLSDTASLGSKGADVIVQNGCGREQRIEVKASAKQAFSEFGDKDINADILVWVHFGDLFANDDTSIEVLVLRNPKRFFDRRRKITLATFKKCAGGDVERTVVTIDSLMNGDNDA